MIFVSSARGLLGHPAGYTAYCASKSAIDGITKACEELGIPITGGNVSFYNETLGEGIYPTPVLGVVGILDDVHKTAKMNFAAPARAAMLDKSPTSQAIALRQMEVGATVDFYEALRMDYRIVSRICLGHDFYEGVRAVIVDKDNRPQWSAPPSREEVDAYFAPLGDELTFPTACA